MVGYPEEISSEHTAGNTFINYQFLSLQAIYHPN